MLRPKQLAALFLFSLIAFIPYLLTPTIGGFDSYYYLSESNLPQSAFLCVKVLIFCCLFVSTVVIAELGSLFTKNGWYAGFLAFASPVFLMEFWKFENDQFVFPILFLSLLLFFKNKKLTAVFLLLPAFFLWEGSVLYLIAFALISEAVFLLLIPITIFVLIIKWEWLLKIANLLPNLAVQENFPIIGVLYHTFALFGTSGIPKKLAVPTIFFLVLAFLNAKYAIHLVPFLAVGLACLADQTKIKPLKGLILATPVVVLLIMTPFVFSYPPTEEHTAAVQLAVREAKGETIYNDWSYGHLIEYYGGKPIAKSGGRQPDLNCSDCTVVSMRENHDFNCRCLNCPSKLPVYKC